MFMRRKMRDYLAVEFSRRPEQMEPKLARLVAQELVSRKRRPTFARDRKIRQKPVIAPSMWMYWNVHLDGLERTHDLIVEREGVFRECVLAMRMAKLLGYQVATNTTIYKETDMREIEQMFEFSARSVWTGTPSRPATNMTRRRKT
jgi:hypothetical protein